MTAISERKILERARLIPSNFRFIQASAIDRALPRRHAKFNGRVYLRKALCRGCAEPPSRLHAATPRLASIAALAHFEHDAIE